MNQHFNTMCREAPLCGQIQINMEQKTIPFNKGIVRNTSLATDGELTDCVNLMPKNGQMMNAPVLTEALTETGETLTLGNMETLLYIHPTSVGDKYIIKEGTNIKVKDSGTTVYTLTDEETLYEVKHIGNVLVVLTSKRTAMFLYDNNNYIDYSFDFDNIDIAFGLEGSMVKTSKNMDIAVVKNDAKNTLYTDELFANGSFNGVSSYTIPLVNKTLDKNKGYKIKVNRDDSASGTIHYKILLNDTEYEKGKIYSNKNEYFITSFENDVSKIELKFGYFISYQGSASAGVQTEWVETKPAGSVSIWESKGEINGYRVHEDDIDAVLGHANSFIQEQAVDKERFMFPFFVRYAIELLDGTHVKPSAPCLMIPSTGIVPYVQTLEVTDTNGDRTEIYATAFVADLTYRILTDVTKLKNLDKIVKGISIAVSSPIYKYDQGAKDTDIISEYMDFGTYDQIADDLSFAKDINEGGYTRFTKKQMDIRHDSNRGTGTDTKPLLTHINLPRHKDISEQIENASVFRIIHTIPLEELKTMEVFVTLPIEEGTLKGLEGKPMLSDDATSLNRIIADKAFTYNGRLNLANLTEYYFNGYKPTLMNGWSDPEYLKGANGKLVADKRTNYQAEATLSINNETKNAIIVDDIISNTSLRWIYFPNASASSAKLYRKVGSDNSYLHYITTIQLKKHPFLNGAYWFNNFNSPFHDDADLVYGSDYPQLTDTFPIVDSPNKIKTSEVNNPFVMKQTTSLNDEVVALATATKALSEGQFGQFPLYAFCKDGIWALEPSSDGTYASKQPVSRDICSNPKAITQTDNAVVYPTMQGLKLLQGSTTTNISNVMDGKTEDTSFLKDIIADYNKICLTDNADFNEAIQDAVIAYDYINSLLHIYTSNASYIYNLESGDWTRTDDPKPTAIVAGYPHSTIQIEAKLYHYDKPASDGTRKGMLLTRETAFDDPLTMKIIKDLRVMRKHGNAKVAVWVSNDRQNWGRLTSLRMHSYKWYRFAVFTELNNTDALEGIVARIESRKTNKMR